MKNNKIYMTLAHLYNQIKGVVGGSDRTLSEEIDKRIVEHKEVVDARKGYPTLKEKIDIIDTAIDGAGAVSMELSGRIGKTENNIEDINQEIEVIKTTNPVVELENGNHVLVNFDKRPSHKSDTFTLNANEQYRTNANMEHYVNQLYVRDNIHNKEIDLSFKPSSVFDETVNELRDGSLYSIYNGEIKMPTHSIVIANKAEDNLASVPGIMDIYGIINSAYTGASNHVVSAFKSGYTWRVKSSTASIIVEFVKPIHLNKINFSFTSNTVQQSVSASVKTDNGWNEIQKVPSTKGYVDINQEVSSIKLTFSSITNDASTVLEIKDIELIARSFNEYSGFANVIELVDLYDLSGYATFAPIVDVPNDTICKFGINHSNDTDSCYVYYPSRRFLESGLFTNVNGLYTIGDIKSSIKESAMLDYVFKTSVPVGNEPHLSIGGMGWKEDSEVTFKDGYPFGAYSYANLYIKTKTESHLVPLTQSMINKVTQVTVDGTIVNIEVKSVGCLKIGVSCAEPINEVRCVLSSLQNVFDSGNGTSVRPVDGSNTSIEPNLVEYYDIVKVKYNCYKQHYSWQWANDKYGWVYSNSTYSKYNGSENNTIVMVDNNNVISNRRKHYVNNYTRHDENSFVLNQVTECSIYVGANTSAVDAFKKDGKIIPTSNVERTTPANVFIGRMKRDNKQNVVKVEPDQHTERLDDVEYWLSGNNYNFYIYKHDTNSWVISKDGMSAEALARIPQYAYDKLFGGEDIFVKVKINNASARVRGVEIEFDKDKYKEVSTGALGTYGMNLSDLKDISAKFIMELINKFSTVAVMMESKSKLQCWQYVVPGIQMIEYGGISWNLADQTIATQHISGNMLIIKNVSKEVKYFKLEQKFFEDAVVVVGDKVQNQKIDEILEVIDDVNNGVADMSMRVDVLDQNVQLLKEAMESGQNPPADLPSFIIPSQIEVDLEPLAPGASTEIRNIKNLRYVQYWDTQLHPVPEFVEHKAVRDLQHHFIYTNGVFTSTHYEMDRYYDTDNSYHMPESPTTNSPTQFTTPDYTCVATRSDGAKQNPISSPNLSVILTTPEDGSSWSYSPWNSSYSVHYDLPGEEARWVDIDFTFNEERFIHGILGMDFGAMPGNGPTGGYTPSLSTYANQITTVFIDLDGSNNWIEHTKFTGYNANKNVYINKPLRKIRIRLEIPYSADRGKGNVMLKHIDIYYCPVRYLHDVDATIMPILYYDTSSWDRLLSVYSDASITGINTDIRYLFETNNELQNDKKYWKLEDGVLVETKDMTYANGMLLYDFNNLTEDQLLPLMNYMYVRPIAILDSVDGHHTPCLRTMRMNYAEKYTETTTLVNPQDINTQYDKEKNAVVVTNATNSIKTLKAIIS